MIKRILYSIYLPATYAYMFTTRRFKTTARTKYIYLDLALLSICKPVDKITKTFS